jgi:hypothetical protein
MLAPGVEGCKGSVNWQNRDQLCAPGCAACSAADWMTYRGSKVPAAHYWTRENLLYNGTAGACWVSAATGNSCPANQPMRICAPSQTDAYGNYCEWTNCGDEANGNAFTDEYFGGCTGSGGAATAGTLYCCNHRPELPRTAGKNCSTPARTAIGSAKPGTILRACRLQTRGA